MLFTAPGNDARERAGLPAFNGLWLWGNADAGTAAPDAADAANSIEAPGLPANTATFARVDAFAAPGEDGDLARGAAHFTGGSVHTPDAGFAALARATGADARTPGSDVDARSRGRACVLVALPPLRGADDLSRWDAAWFAPAAEALGRGLLERVTLIADGDGAYRWTSPAPPWRARVRARFGSPPFGSPRFGAAR